MKIRRGFNGEKLPRGIYIRPGDQYYSYAFKSEKGKYIRKFTKERDLKLAVKMLHDAITETHKIDFKYKQREVRLSQAFRDYIASYAKSNKDSWKTNEAQLKRFLEYFGDIFIHHVTLKMLLDYRPWRQVHSNKNGLDTISFATSNRDLSLLRGVINFAVSYYDLEFLNPFIKYKRELKFPSEKPNQRTRYLSIDEKARLFGVLSPKQKRLVFFALNTGMRQGEIMKAKWRDIDWEAPNIKTISKSNNFRFIKFDGKMREFLKRMPKISEFIFGYEGYDGIKDLWWHFRSAWECALKRAKIEDFTFHDLRHTFATISLGKGVDLPTLQALLGHADIRMTMRYAHVTDKQKHEAAILIGSAFEEITLDLLAGPRVTTVSPENVSNSNVFESPL